MSAIDRQLASQVCTVLIDAELSLPSLGEPFTDETIELRYLPRFEIKQLKDPRIIVAPRARSLQAQSRSSQRREHAVQVCVMMKCDPDSELMDELIDLVATIDDTLANVGSLQPTKNRVATWLSSQTDEIYNIDHLEQHGVFRSVITANYLLIK